MRKMVVFVFVLALALPLSAAKWEGVALMDANCAAKEKVMAHPEEHSRMCAIKCGEAGYGAVVDGKFVKFDKKGNELAAAALKDSKKKDNLRANITGKIKDGTLQVSSLKLD